MYTENMFGYVKMPDGAIAPLGDMVAKGIADATGKVWRNTPDTSTDIRKFYHEYLSARNALAEMMPRLQMADMVPILRRDNADLKKRIEAYEIKERQMEAARKNLHRRMYEDTDGQPVSAAQSAAEYMRRHRTGQAQSQQGKEPMIIEHTPRQVAENGTQAGFLTGSFVKKVVERG